MCNIYREKINTYRTSEPRFSANDRVDGEVLGFFTSWLHRAGQPLIAECDISTESMRLLYAPQDSVVTIYEKPIHMLST